MSSSFTKDLMDYIDAGFPIIYIRTFEEEKADRLIRSAAKSTGKGVIEWNGAIGFSDFASNAYFTDMSLEATLKMFRNDKKALHKKLLVIKDASYLLGADTQNCNPTIVALLKEIARKIRCGDIDTTVIFIAPTLQIPKVLEKLVTVMELPLSNKEEILNRIRNFSREQHGGDTAGNCQESNDNDDFKSLANALKGLTETEINDLLSLANTKHDGDLDRSALDLIFTQKKQMVLKTGILEMVDTTEDIKNIGGLQELKKWLERKKEVLDHIDAAKEFGVPAPKGVLIVGAPGCGKSLTAKAASTLIRVPLLKLDMGRLMGKYVGESEDNMRRAIELAEAMSPCVLWIDEIEKAFAGISSEESGVVMRMFGAFLTWMQEKTCNVFVIATANDVIKLPPELLRKGRFDEIFYVGLPSAEERKAILKIHLKKCNRVDTSTEALDLTDEELRELASDKFTKGYSGADLESIISEAVERAFVQKRPKIMLNDVKECIKSTQPLSVIMKNELEKMNKIYAERNFKKA